MRNLRPGPGTGTRAPAFSKSSVASSLPPAFRGRGGGQFMTVSDDAELGACQTQKCKTCRKQGKKRAQARRRPDSAGLALAETFVIKILFKKMLTPSGVFEKLAPHTESNISTQ